MAAVQLIGKDSVLDCYSATRCDAWAIYEGKRLCIRGDNAADLDDWISRFLPADSTGIYTLKVYEDSDKNSNEGYMASFNFKISDPYSGAGIGGYQTKMDQRLTKLEKSLSGDGDDDDGDGMDINSIVMGWLKNPTQLGQVVGAFRQLMGVGDGAAALAPPLVPGVAATIGSVEVSGAESDDEKIDRLSKVLDRLEKKDKNILTHLEKLAEIAETKPGLFNVLTAQLDGI